MLGIRAFLEFAATTPLQQIHGLVKGIPLILRNDVRGGELRVKQGPVYPLLHLEDSDRGPWDSADPGPHVMAEVNRAGIIVFELWNGLRGAA